MPVTNLSRNDFQEAANNWDHIKLVKGEAGGEDRLIDAGYNFVKAGLIAGAVSLIPGIGFPAALTGLIIYRAKIKGNNDEVAKAFVNSVAKDKFEMQAGSDSVVVDNIDKHENDAKRELLPKLNKGRWGILPRSMSEKIKEVEISQKKEKADYARVTIPTYQKVGDEGKVLDNLDNKEDNLGPTGGSPEVIT